MKRSVFALGMMVAVGLFPAACGPESQLDGELAGPGLRAMAGKPGSEDTNGTPNRAWHTWKEPLARALGFPLLQADGTINPVVLATGLLDEPKGDGAGGGGQGGGAERADGEDVTGHEIFDHAVRCALARGTVVTHDDMPYVGRGMVSGASIWTARGLPVQVRNNVLECVIAFVNDKMDDIAVMIAGYNVIDDGNEHGAFKYSEALWCAHATAGAEVEVYPTFSFAQRCGPDPKTALEQRYCYEKDACGLIYKGILDFTAECKGDPDTGQYRCDDKPCTMTWLKDPMPGWCVPPVGSPSFSTSPPPPPPPPTSSSPPPPPPPPIPQ
ncbi:hypothetical protein WME76_12745 [Sorangium sp. So ce119]|uniref:hypothetical protein n=1 Tax=Sorangium sp. So ce119 TaxID=3133279 RepID=UPI003F646992